MKFIPYNGDLYHVYYRDGCVTSIAVRYDNIGLQTTPIEWGDLPPALRQKIDDEINLLY